MTFNDLVKFYEEKKIQYGKETFKHVSELLQEAKSLHKKDFKGIDHEQSWRTFKIRNLKKLIKHIINDVVSSLGVSVVNGEYLKMSDGTELSFELSKVKRYLVVDYGVYGAHLPEVDIIIYDPRYYRTIAVISVRESLQESSAQMCYWKLKLKADKITKHVKVFILTFDEYRKKNQSISNESFRMFCELDIDGAYVLSETENETQTYIKSFDRLILDLIKIINKHNKKVKKICEKNISEKKASCY